MIFKRCAFLLTSLALTLCACGERGPEEKGKAAGPPPAAASGDRAWITLHGTVLSALPSSFDLDYGAGTVRVEMDDWDWYMEGQALKPGNEVRVSGRIDKDLHERRTIEAESVYVKDVNTYYHASSADEEDIRSGVGSVRNGAGPVDAAGHVVAIDGREFLIGSPHGNIRIDTAGLKDNPLDGEGRQRLRIGDRVYAWGDLDLGTSGGRPEILADGVVTLSADRRKRM